MSLTQADVDLAGPPRRSAALLWSSRSSRQRILISAALTFLLLSVVREKTGAYDLTSSGTVTATLHLALPILFAGLSGLWAERVGIVNIGIEGMMILGTWGGGFGAWKYGPWVGLLFAMIGGMIGGMVHALATVRFNVDHVISGFSINLLAAGAVRYLSAVYFVGKKGAHGGVGSVSLSPPQKGTIPEITLRFITDRANASCLTKPSGLFWVECRRWFVVSDAAGIARGFLSQMSLATILGLGLVPITAWIMWRTRFGLRLRSSGEAPSAAESLGVKVLRLRYIAMAVSGAMAGLGGGYLAIVTNTQYKEGMTANRGYIGLATMIFGNWRPTGLLGGAALFSYSDALRLRNNKSIPALLLFVGLILLLFSVSAIMRQRWVTAYFTGGAALLFFVLYATVHRLSDDLTSAAPYIITLIVLASASQRLRPPAFSGRPYRPGDSH